jgi:hypothetical protein
MEKRKHHHTSPTWATVTLLTLFALLVTSLLPSCDYDETVETCPVSVRLIYPDNSIEPYEGARVEMKDATSSIYVDSTDASGTARFNLPPGLYEATTNSQYIDSTGSTRWRYIFNGVKSHIVISPDSTNRIELTLKMSKKRIVE